jgi:RHS repeat-associated protein
MFLSAASNPINQFTGKERDAETGLDYFLARYYSGAQGRFLSPDEFKGGIVDPITGQQVSQQGPLPYGDITAPQTLNKYAYVRNNPLRYVDPDGHDGVLLNDPSGAAGYGHNATIVGNDDDGWTYFSKDGSDSTNRMIPFKTFSEFQKSDTSERYENSFRITTSPKQDANMKATGKENYNKPYSTSEISPRDKKSGPGKTKGAENCADLSATVLKAGGIEISKPKKTVLLIGTFTYPNAQYDRVANENKGKKVKAHCQVGQPCTQ